MPIAQSPSPSAFSETFTLKSTGKRPTRSSDSSSEFDQPPAKAPRHSSTTAMTALRRSETLLFIPSTHHQQEPPMGASPNDNAIPYTRTLRYYKDVRDRRPRCTRRPEVIVLHTPESASNQKLLLPFAPAIGETSANSNTATTAYSSPYTSPLTTSPPRSPRPLTRSRTVSMHLSSLAGPPKPTPSPPVNSPPTPSSRKPTSTKSKTTTSSATRTTSPLAPAPMPLPPRVTFPRSKPTPNLHRAAIQACMRCSPHGQKILHMGARLAVSLAAATEELERLVAQQNTTSAGTTEQQRGIGVDDDVTMEDVESMSSVPPGMSNSWVEVQRTTDDWVMLDQTQCVA